MQKKYKIGYVPGVFDLFHIGHLNLIRKSKMCSEYLIAGVLSDELVYHFKKKYPIIPFEERYEIVKAIKEVDEVVKVDFDNTVKMDAWNLYHYDAYFSGSDHGHEWNHEKKALNELGSDIVFFPYTESTSSTQIRKQITAREKPVKVYLFGAGQIGKNTLMQMQSEQERNKWQILGFLDNSVDKHLTKVQDVVIYKPEDLLRLEQGQNDFVIKITMKDTMACLEQLKKMGLAKYVESFEDRD